MMLFCFGSVAPCFFCLMVIRLRFWWTTDEGWFNCASLVLIIQRNENLVWISAAGDDGGDISLSRARGFAAAMMQSGAGAAGARV
jgi:hypothetical protein